MSEVTELSYREAVPVVIGGSTLYCERFRAFSVRRINEESDAAGGTVITNNATGSTKLIFTGRICTEGSPEDFIYSFNELVHSASAIAVEYMGLSFTGCRILSYSFEDRGGEWADVSVTLMTSETITRSSAQ